MVRLPAVVLPPPLPDDVVVAEAREESGLLPALLNALTIKTYVVLEFNPETVAGDVVAVT
jgi:hypothetical protein